MLGRDASGAGEISVDAGRWTNAGTVTIGGNGSGLLNVINNGVVTTNDILVADMAGSSGGIVMSGAGSTVSAGSSLIVGNHGNGQISVGSGAVLTSGETGVGYNTNGLGLALVDGAGSKWNVQGFNFVIGGSGVGQVVVGNGATLLSRDTHIAEGSGSGGSFLTIQDSGSTWTGSGDLLIGQSASGSLNIKNGAVATITGATDAGFSNGSTGAILVDGANSHLTLGALNLGDSGAGTLTITNQGLVTSEGDARLAVNADGHGAAIVDGGSQWDLGLHTLFVGAGGTGEVTVSNGSSLVSASILLGNLHGSSGTVTVQDAGSSITTSGSITVAQAGQGSLIVKDGATITAGGPVGTSVNSGSTATIEVNGAGAHLTSGGEFFLGIRGDGTLNVSGGGLLTSQDDAHLASEIGAHAVATIDGAGSKWDIGAQRLMVGEGGTGTLTVSNGGALVSGFAILGNLVGASGTATVQDAGSSWTSSGEIDVAQAGQASLIVKDGATVATGIVGVGVSTGSTGTIEVSGAGAHLTSGGEFFLGARGDGTLNISGGGLVTSQDNAHMASFAGAHGTATIDGAGSKWDLGAHDLTVGEGGTGQLTVQNGGAVVSGITILGSLAGSNGTATVQGAGTTWTNSSFLTVGDFGTGTLAISGGATVSAGGTGVFIGEDNGGAGTVTVDGAGSKLVSAARIVVGDHSSGTMILSNGGTATATTDLTIANNAAGFGKLIIGADAGSAAVAAGTLTAPTVIFGAGNGAIIFNHTNTNYNFAPAISGNGEIDQVAGVTHLTANNNAFTGHINVVGGTLMVDGTTGTGPVSVVNDGKLGGTGFINGDVAITNGGTLVGVQGQTLTMNSLALTDTSHVDVTLNDVGTTELFHITNGLTLDGRLDIHDAGTFGPGVYRIMTYGGVLTPNGLDIGTTPDGTTASDFSIQTSVAGQVNLIDAAAAQLRFWDGGAPANANNGVVDGGSGVWSVTAPNFTDGGGMNNGSQTPQPGFIVFEGAGGTVTVDYGGGAVAAKGMQFASDGYVINGDPLTLADAQTTIRVGDGTGAGAGYTATIDASLTGAGGLNKTDLGTLVLTGVNDFTGATTITDGMLALTGAGSIAASSGVVDNGVFSIAGTTSGAAIKSLSGAGLVDLGTATSKTLTLTGASGTFAGVIAGIGAVAVTGGTETFTGVNVYTGRTTITGGTLALAGNGSIAASSGVTDNGVFDISGTNAGASIAAISGNGEVHLGSKTLTITNAGNAFDGVISGAGGLNIANGLIGFTGANTYTGGTTIGATAGLVLGNTAASGSIVGDVVDNGIMGFGRTDAYTFAGNISGTGQVAQTVSGTTTLTGVNTYTGGTFILLGTLIGSATSFGSGGITNNAALVIDQAADADFANVISGNGIFTKQGAGSLNLTGTNTFTGSTIVAGGRLAVNGSLADSIVTVQSGGILGGNGTVGGVIAQSGGIVGPGNSIGTLTVNGNYTQAAGSTYQVELTTTGLSDRINVSGSATIGSGAVLDIVKMDAGPYVLGTHYTVLTAAGSVTGTYALTGDLTAFYSLAASYDANDVYLDVVQTKSFAGAGVTPNQIATGQALGSLPVNGPLATAVANLPTDAAARNAFDQLSGEAHASLQTALIADSHFVRDAAMGRIRAAFYMVGASQAPVYAYADDGAPHAVAASAERLVFWGEGFGSWGSTDGDGNAARLGRSTTGFLLGADAPMFYGWRLGVLGGYSRTSVNVNDRGSSGSSDNYHLGIYTGTQIGAVGIRGGAAYTWHNIELSRSISFAGFGDKLTSEYLAGTAQMFGEVGYRLDAGRFAFEPFGGLSYVNLRTDAFTERGGPAALSAKSEITGIAFSTLGLRGASDFGVGASVFTAHGMLGWRYAFGDVTAVSTFAFSGGDPFVIAGVPVARNSLAVEAGLDTTIFTRATLGLSYAGQIAGHARDNAFKANLNVKF